jgi:hypothetical protein
LKLIEIEFKQKHLHSDEYKNELPSGDSNLRPRVLEADTMTTAPKANKKLIWGAAVAQTKNPGFAPKQGCQMANFQTKNIDLGLFWSVLQ